MCPSAKSTTPEPEVSEGECAGGRRDWAPPRVRAARVGLPELRTASSVSGLLRTVVVHSPVCRRFAVPALLHSGAPRSPSSLPALRAPFELGVVEWARETASGSALARRDTDAWLGVQYIGDRDPDRIAEYVQEREDALDGVVAMLDRAWAVPTPEREPETVNGAGGRKLGV